MRVLSNIIDSGILATIYAYLHRHKIFYENQYGFRTKTSIIDEVTKYTADANRYIDEKHSTMAVYLGSFENTFDAIDSNILQGKL